MKKALPVLVALSLLLGACGKPSQSLQPSPVAGDSVQVDLDKFTPMAPVSPAQEQEPAQLPETEPLPPAVAEPAVPAIRWVIEGRGGPITSGDSDAEGKKVVLLTFDDGPDPDYTPRILDALKAHNAKALWFVSGNAGLYPDLIKRMDAEGHLVGTHTLHHKDLRQMSRVEQEEAIGRVNEMVSSIIGKKPRYFRPPFGAYNDVTLALMEQLEMQLVNWSHGSGDWMDTVDGYKDPQIIIQDVLSESPRPNMTPLHPGAVILMHDTHKHTADALPEILKGLKEKGYEFAIPER